MRKHHVSIIGASGYSGAELIQLLKRHPSVEVDKLFANTSAGKQLADVFPRFGKTVPSTLELFSSAAVSKSDLVFIALPSGEAMNIVPEILKAGKRVIDLGGDFRLKDPALYQKYYKHQHTAHEHLSTAVYGLPEWYRARIASAQLVANPGCYPTSALLPLLPLLKEELVEPIGITISSLSGVSGAGRSASVDMSFSEVNESVRAYKVGVHQHIPEIKSVLEEISGRSVGMTFVPHLIPITRGIHSSIYAPVKKTIAEQDILAVYERYYKNEPFVRYSATEIPEIKNVNYTNFLDIGFRVYPENNQVIVLSVIDNLVKGAAGQAMQNMNIMFGFNETEGLL